MNKPNSQQLKMYAYTQKNLPREPKYISCLVIYVLFVLEKRSRRIIKASCASLAHLSKPRALMNLLICSRVSLSLYCS